MSNQLIVPLAKAPQSQTALVWRQFRRHKLAVASAIVLILLAFMSVFAEQIAPHDPNVTHTDYAHGKPQPPSAEYLLGTDNFGRDYFARTLVGMRISLIVGVTAVIFQLGIGILVGALSGYFGGGIDNLLMRITDIFLSVPAFLLLLIMAGILGGGLIALIIAIGALNWMIVARLVRAEILSLKEREFVLAGRSIGVPAWRLILVYLLPNTAGSIIVAATLAVPGAILTESALSFLGLGVPPPNASLGNMLGDAQQWIRTAWWIWIVPGVAISMIVLAFNFVGDGLRDALDPQLRD